MRLRPIEARFRATRAVVHDLARTPHLAGADDVALAHLPPADANLLRQAIHHPFHRELGLVGAEATERPTHRVVGAHGGAVHVDVGHPVRAARVAGSTLEHLHPHARVGAAVADAAHAQRGQVAVGIATCPVLEANRVPLGMDQEALLARERALHRALQQEGSQRGLPLVAHVLLAAERTTVGDQLHRDRVDAHTEQSSDLVAVVPHSLATRVDQQVPVAGHRQRALGLEEGVLDALRVEHLVHHVRAGGQRVVGVATRVFADGEHVVLGAEHRDLGVVDGGDRIDDRPQHPVLHLHQRSRRSRLLLRLRNHDRQHVAGIRGALAFTDEHGPVLVDDAHVLLARYVGCREDAHHAVGGSGDRGVDAHDVGAHVGGEVQRPVQHAGHAQVVDVAAVAQGELGSLVLGAAGADAARQCRVDRCSLGDSLDGVEHLHVPGAPAQVGAEVAGHVVALQPRALLVDLRLRPHHDARDAVAALQATTRGEGIGEARAFRFVDALERGDDPAGSLLHRVRAGDLHLAVDHHRAAPALTLRRAAVLG